MSKTVYESIIIVTTSTIIFGCALFIVLLFLIWPGNSLIPDAKLALALSIPFALVFFLGLLATIYESIRFLVLYAVLIAIYPLTGSLTVIVHHTGDYEGKLAILAIILLLGQILVAYLLAKEIRARDVLLRGIDYKACNLDGRSEGQEALIDSEM